MWLCLLWCDVKLSGEWCAVALCNVCFICEDISVVVIVAIV